MITPSIAITGGYRFQPLSNAGLGHRNRGTTTTAECRRLDLIVARSERLQ